MASYRKVNFEENTMGDIFAMVGFNITLKESGVPIVDNGANKTARGIRHSSGVKILNEYKNLADLSCSKSLPWGEYRSIMEESGKQAAYHAIKEAGISVSPGRRGNPILGKLKSPRRGIHDLRSLLRGKEHIIELNT